MKIPFYKPSFSFKELEEVRRILRAGKLSVGYEIDEFEVAFAQYIGSRYAVAVDSCTSGLFLSLKYNNIGAEDTVQIPSLTFASVGNVILHCGAKIKWEDVSYVGRAYHLKHTRPTKIVDSAHELERLCYTNPDIGKALTCYSFYPTKQLASAEGGMVATDDSYAVEWLKKARWHGRSGKGFDYSIDFPGWKMNMTNVQAVIGLVQLNKLDEMNYRRRKILEKYNRELGENCDSLHLYTIQVDDREDFLNYMNKFGVDCSVHFYTPLHQQPAFKEFKTCLPETDNIAKRTVSLPFFPGLFDDQVEYVIKLVKEWRVYEREIA